MALTNVCILKYNNYYNQIEKRPALSNGENVVSQYINLSPSYYEQFTGINFYKADNVDTEIVLNTTKFGCDYLVEYDSYNIVISRWFIIECKQTRAGQNVLQLHRDLVIDNLDALKNADIFVEKATIQSNDDIAIYNKEDIEFNQIKTNETLLKDKSQTPWIIGFVTPPVVGEQAETVTVLPRTFSNYVPITSLSSWEYNELINETKKIIDLNSSIISISSTLEIEDVPDPQNAERYVLNDRYYRVSTTTKYKGTVNYGDEADVYNTFNLNRDNIWDKFLDLFDVYSKLNGILDFENKYLFAQDTGKVYRVNLNKQDRTWIGEHLDVDGDEAPSMGHYLGLLSNKYHYDRVGANDSGFTFSIYYNQIRLTLTEVTISDTLSFTGFGSTVQQLIDAPYRMFAMPLEAINVRTNASTTFTTTDKLTSLNIAANIANKLTTSKLIDFMLLPYCPLQNRLTANNEISIIGLTNGTDYSIVKDSNNVNKHIVFYCTTSNFSFDITNSITIPNSVLDKKVVAQCDMYRLVSPNYASSFDFNPIKANGVTKFKVDITYKPYNPYIHIIGDFSGLYGTTYVDNMPIGLICQGDFSIPFTSDKWQEYQINNKNFLNTFNRQIESIELNNKYQKIQDIVNAASGTVSGGVSGGTTGAITGGVPGAIIGAAVGSAASGVAGVMDVKINETLRKDALDLTKDQFNYSLGNIQALPSTLAKVSAYDFNNKLYPILEYYTCTDQEKDIFKDKLKYNGMTIMRIDKLSNFLNTTEQYFKGKIVRMDVYDDFHSIKVLSNELNKGIYISIPNEV